MNPRAHDEGDLLSKNFTVPLKFSLTYNLLTYLLTTAFYERILDPA